MTLLSVAAGLNGAALSLPQVSTAPGGSIILPIQFAAQGESVSGLQFDLQYDSAVIALTAAVLGDPARNSLKRLYVADLNSTKKRFLIVGLNQNLIDDGDLLNIFINTAQNAPGGVYTLKFSNVLASSPRGEPVTVSASDGTVVVQVGATGISLQSNGVLSAASLRPGPLAPGELLTLIGSMLAPFLTQQPTGSPGASLLGTRVLFDGTPAPVLFLGPNQINAIVPYAVSGQGTTQLEIVNQSQIIAALPLPTSAAAPAIFTLDASGVGPGAILNDDETVNSPANPAERGGVISVFATGAGQMDPAGIDGQVTGSLLSVPILPVSVQIAGINTQILYAGAAPGLVAGVLQVNTVVPQEAPSAPAVPIALLIGSGRSPPGVTVSVK